MDGKLPAGTVRLLVSEIRGQGIGSDFVEWAAEALGEGFDSPTLRGLAGLGLGGQPSAFEAAAKFRTALGELRVEVPDRHTLIRTYVREIARDIVSGALAPQAGVGRIHREVLAPFEHPADLMPWCYLWEGLHPVTFAGLDGEALDAVIRSTAAAWAEPSGPGSGPPGGERRP